MPLFFQALNSGKTFFEVNSTNLKLTGKALEAFAEQNLKTVEDVVSATPSAYLPQRNNAAAPNINTHNDISNSTFKPNFGGPH